MSRTEAKTTTSDSLMGYLVCGLIVQVVGVVMLGVGLEDDSTVAALVGGIVATIGAIITLIGTVAMGVLLGLRARAGESA